MKKFLTALLIAGGLSMVTAPVTFAYPPDPTEEASLPAPPPAVAPAVTPSPASSGLPATGGSGFSTTIVVGSGLTLVGVGLAAAGRKRAQRTATT